MKKRMLPALLLALSLLFSVSGAGAESTPLLYQVQDENGHVIYLLGTIHLGNEAMYPLSEAVERAYREADILAVEMDLIALTEDAGQMLKYSMALMYGTEDSARNHLSPDVFALGVEKLGQAEAVLEKLHIAAWLSLAQEQLYASIGRESNLGVDQHLLSRAHADGKEIHALETLEEQLQLLLDMPDAMVDEQLRMLLAEPKAAAFSINLLSNAWEKGSEPLLTLLLSQEQAAIPPEHAQEYTAYYQRMYSLRNAAFEEDAIRYLSGGRRVLFAVGAAHIVGEDGLAQRLERAGYTVTEIGK